MSFGVASQAKNINKQYSTLWLVGGYNCNPNFDPLTSAAMTNVDLRVLGGAEIYKDLCVNGNIMGNLLGNICSRIIQTDIITDKANAGVLVTANLSVDPSYTLFARESCFYNTKFDCLTSRTPLQDIQIKANVNLNCGIVGNVATLETERITNKPGGADLLIIPEGNTVIKSQSGQTFICDDTFVAGNLDVSECVVADKTVTNNVFTTAIREVETIVGNGNALVMCNDGDIVIKPQNGNLILYNTAEGVDFSKKVLSNILTIQSSFVPSCDLELEAGPGKKIVISNGDGIDMMGRDICNANLIIGEDITIKSNVWANGINSVACINENGVLVKGGCDSSMGGNLTVEGDLDMFCNEITNVQAIFVDQVFGKNSPVNFEDSINIRDNGGDSAQITFVAGIEIGNSTTSATNANSIAVGKGAVATESGAIAIGAATANSPDEICIGSTSGNINATAKAWGQIFQNRAWDDGNVQLAFIDGSGNIQKGNLIVEGPPGEDASIFRVDANTCQTIATGTTGNVLSLTIENPNNINVPGTWDSGNSTFTIVQDGWYHLNAAANFGNVINNKFGLYLLVNDSEIDCTGQSQLLSTTLDAVAHADCITHLNFGDEIKLRAKQTTGTDQDICSAHLAIHYLPGTNQTVFTDTIVGNVVGGNLVAVNVLCALDKLETNEIDTKSGNVITMNCVELDDLQAIHVDQVFGKNSPVNFEDNANFRSGHKITFVEGIMIGNVETTAPNVESIAIGKGANAPPESIVIGENAGKNITLPGYYTGYSDRMVVIGGNAMSSFVYSYYDQGAVIIGHNAASSKSVGFYYGSDVVIGGNAAERQELFGGSVIIGYDAMKYQAFEYYGVGFQYGLGYNVILGKGAAKYGTSYRSTIIGAFAAYYLGENTYNAYTVNARGNTVMGYASLANGNCQVGCYLNTALGMRVMSDMNGISSCEYNVAVGAESLKAARGARHNIAIGAWTLTHGFTPSSTNEMNYNIVLGKNRVNETANLNGPVNVPIEHQIIIGHNAHGQTAVGTSVYNTKNIHIGNDLTEQSYSAARTYNITIGHDITLSARDYNIGIGHNAGIFGYNVVAIGYSVTGSGNDNVVIGSGASSPNGCNNTIVIGKDASASTSSDYSIILGAGVTSTGNASVTIGYDASVTASYGIAVGAGATAPATEGIAIGKNALTSATFGGAIAIGTNANAGSYTSISIGKDTMGTGDNVVCVGRGGEATGSAGISIGLNTDSLGTSSIGIGTDAVATNNYSIAIGRSSGTSGDDAVAIGRGSSATASGTVALGIGGTASEINAVGIGKLNKSSGNAAVVIGAYAEAYGQYSIAIGGGDSVNITESPGDFSISLGYRALADSDYSISIGKDSKAGSKSISIGHKAAMLVTPAYGYSDRMVVIGGNAMSSFVYSYYDQNAVVIGYNAAASQTQGLYYGPNVVIGGNAAEGQDLFSGSVIIGYDAMKYQSFNYYGVGFGYGLGCNVIIGRGAAKYGASYRSTIVGCFAGYYLAEDAYNAYTTNGRGNCAFGYSAMINGNCTAGCYLNTAMGMRAMSDQNGIYACKYNVSIGAESFKAARGAEHNIAIGTAALTHGFTPSSTNRMNYNIVIGKNRVWPTYLPGFSGPVTVPVEDIIIIGHNSHGQNTATGTSVYNTKNIHIGNDLNEVSYTLGRTYNITIGHDVSLSNVDYNVGIGHSADIFGDNLVAIGYNVTGRGNDNVVIGSGATTPTGCNNTVVIGKDASATSASDYSIIIGSGVNSTGNASVTIGYDASVTASDGIAIGAGSTTTASGAVALGTGITAGVSNGFFVTRTTAGSGTTAIWNGNQLQLLSSAARFKENIRALEDMGSLIDQLKPSRFKAKLPPQRECIGLIAEDVEQVFPELVTYEEDGETLQSVMYEHFVSVLIKEVQSMRNRLSAIEDAVGIN